jgi:hypothetical protein
VERESHSNKITHDEEREMTNRTTSHAECHNHKAIRYADAVMLMILAHANMQPKYPHPMPLLLRYVPIMAMLFIRHLSEMSMASVLFFLLVSAVMNAESKQLPGSRHRG